MLPEQQTFLSLPSSVCNSQINWVAKFLISIVAFCTEEFKSHRNFWTIQRVK